LNGTVSSKAEADRAVAIANEAEGVKSVTSHLVVKAA
jgi:osmotically-inducible protein OsmY